jgi:hypothetical protein
MTKLALLFFAAALCVARAPAADAVFPDHLEPEGSVLAGGESKMHYDYLNLVASVLHEGYADDVELRAVVLPSFTPEYLVGIRGALSSDRLRGNPASHRVFYLRPKLQLWSYPTLSELEDQLARMKSKNPPNAERIKLQSDDIAAIRRELPADPKDMPLARCEKPIDAPLADRIWKVWIGVLMETRHDATTEVVINTDGTSYHFSAPAPLYVLAGETSAPPIPSTKPGMLATLADALVDYCDGKAAAAELDTRTTALEQRLRK